MSNPILPKGFHPGMWDDYSGYWIDYNNDNKVEKSLTKTCECGTNITMGYEAPPEFHSDWCPLYKKVDEKV